AVHKIPTPFQAYLDRAYADVKKESDQRVLDNKQPWFNPNITHDAAGERRGLIPIAIFLRGTSPAHHEVARVFGYREHFSGSWVKVAAMMAAFRLRKQANDLARDRNAQRTPFVGGDFISALAATINWQDVVSKIKNASGLL